ncbi:MAG: CHAD domain-containing protein [Polyangiaceae bacterium]|jgi:CHAD domain-containing protein|nr:CHAD domain-containing protein [Polyangiaceae bacterium]
MSTSAKLPADAARPPVEVQTTVSDVVAPKLLEWLDDVADAAPRVRDSADPEGVHDLRVAMRRIRSLLRIVRTVFGKYHVDRIRADFKSVADATGSLRDEEVLEETLRALELRATASKALAPWLSRRAQRERILRANVVRLLEAGALEQPSRHLRSLLQLPCKPSRDKEARKFARRVVLDAQLSVDALRSDNVSDVNAMHQLRIAHKRLRYAVEALEPALPPELRAWGQIATRFQKVLGNLHDHDVALQVISDAQRLAPSLKDAIQQSLVRERAKHAAQYVELAGPTLVRPVEQPEPQPPAATPPVAPPPASAPPRRRLNKTALAKKPHG